MPHSAFTSPESVQTANAVFWSVSGPCLISGSCLYPEGHMSSLCNVTLGPEAAGRKIVSLVMINPGGEDEISFINLQGIPVTLSAPIEQLVDRMQRTGLI